MHYLFIPSVLIFSWLTICPSVQAHEAAVVAIRPIGSSARSEYGTGFVTHLYGQKVIVTNIHVIKGVDQPKVIYSESGRPPKMISTKIKKVFPSYDLAVLEPLEELPMESLPTKEMAPAELKGKKNLRVVGYFHGGDNQQDSSVEVTSDQLSSPSYRNESGKLVTPSYRNESGKLVTPRDPVKVITFGGLSYNGMSGSPILLDGHVVGVMWASVNQGGSFCWELPIEYLKIKKGSEDWISWSRMKSPVLDFESLRSGVRTLQDGNLMWQSSTAGMMTWEEAMAYADKMNRESLMGHNDWRLPAAEELLELARKNNNIKSRHWSSDASSSFAKAVDLANKDVIDNCNKETNNFAVRLVRNNRQ